MLNTLIDPYSLFNNGLGGWDYAIVFSLHLAQFFFIYIISSFEMNSQMRCINYIIKNISGL